MKIDGKDIPVKWISIVVAVIVSFFIGGNCFTIIPAGEEGSVTSFGKVHEGKSLKGFNLVLPWWSIEHYNLQHTTFSFDDLAIASKDKFKTKVDVSFTGSFLSGYAAQIREKTGTAEKFLRTHVNKKVLSCITKAGGLVPNSQAFFEKETQEQLSSETQGCVNSYLGTVGGFELTVVQLSDIRLDPIVKSFMVETKKRQEQETQALSLRDIAETNAEIGVNQSLANLKSADNNKKSRMLAADAKFYEDKQKADALLYSKQQEAIGNLELSKSITPALIKYTHTKQWDGVQPKVVSGESGLLLNVGNM